MWWSEFSRTGFSLSGFGAGPLRLLDWVWGDLLGESKEDRLKPVLPKCCFAIFVLFLIAAAPCLATTYFVAAAGSDSNAGTSSGAPWQTIAKVNSSTFAAGDSVLFNRGDIWYGTALVVPSSGSSGSPITFGAYGAGANPIIKGATNLNTSGYVLAPNTLTTIFQRPSLGTSATDSATINFRQGIPVGEISNAAAEITISVTASPTLALNITGAGIGPAATLPNASSITRITWGGGNNGTTVPAGTTVTSDLISYNLNNAAPQVVTLYSTSRNVAYLLGQRRIALRIVWRRRSVAERNGRADIRLRAAT